MILPTDDVDQVTNSGVAYSVNLWSDLVVIINYPTTVYSMKIRKLLEQVGLQGFSSCMICGSKRFQMPQKPSCRLLNSSKKKVVFSYALVSSCLR